MSVRRIVPNLAADDPAGLARFYAAALGLAPVMDHGFIVTLAGQGASSPGRAAPQNGEAAVAPPAGPRPAGTLRPDGPDAGPSGANAASTQSLAGPQMSLASAGGSGTPVPALSIEVDDLDATLAAVTAAGGRIEYGPVAEPWGVRRFFFRDPAGHLINVLHHA